MPLLNEDKSGDTTLYTMSIDGKFALLTEGTSYLCEASTSPAIDLDLPTGAFIVAGMIAARQTAIRLAASGNTVTVEETGSVYGQLFGVFFEGSIGVSTLVNHGTIDGGFSAIRDDQSASGVLAIVNYGQIRSISMLTAELSILNYGTIQSIAGADTADHFDTHLGTTGDISGGGGDDVYIIAGRETLYELTNHGFDSVTSYGDFILPDNFEKLTLAGAARVGFGNASDNLLTANPLGSELRGGAGSDQLFGGVGDDLLRGGAGADQLAGGVGGFDKLYGGTGDDRVQLGGEDGGKAYGQAGDDVLVSGIGADLLNGGDGVDRADYGLSTAAVTVDLTSGRGSGGDAEGDKLVDIEDATGSAFDDVLLGSAGANRLSGGMGTDRLSGLDGADLLIGGGGADVLDGGVGTDTASYATSGDGVRIVLGVSAEFGEAAGDTLIAIENVTGSAFGDKLTGSSGANALVGLGGDDYLLGGEGADVLEGGAGNDELHGDRGRDTFVFSDVTPGVAGGWGKDIVDDFADGADRIDLRGASAVHSFADLMITQGPSGALITIGADTIELWTVTPAQLDPSDFLFA